MTKTVRIHSENDVFQTFAALRTNRVKRNKRREFIFEGVRNINNALRKNRRILQELLRPNEKVTKTKMEKLVERGFLFKYITHTYTNQKGNVYSFCFEYGYMPLENNNYLVVKQKDG